MKKVQTHSVEIGGKTLTFESGRFAHQASGAVFATYGEMAILSTVTMSDSAREGIDFFPLMCDFEPKFYATGKMKGSRFSKREARPPDSAILVSRMIDRPLRPSFPKGMKNEVQIIATLLQADSEHTSAALAINAASTAIQISGIPIEAPVGAVRVGMKDGGYYLDPTFDEIENGKLDLVVAGTEDAVLMVESGADLISNEEMLGALEFAHAEIKKICVAQKEFAAKFEVEAKTPIFAEVNEDAEKAVADFVSDAEIDAIAGVTKKELKKGLAALEDKLIANFAADIEEGKFSEGELKKFLGKAFAASIRRRAFQKDIRIDGRKMDEVRPIGVEVGILPRLHGSALFSRGETQSLSIATVSGPSSEKIIDDPDRPEYMKQYIHHYNFPSYSVGEVRPNRGPSRRDIGHGSLGHRALSYVIPKKERDNFPYVMRVVSEILTCNGSSSMAAVCGSTLALMDAGIKLKSPVSGVAMGLLLDADSGDYRILTDIQAYEDFDGDMDFKVAGDENGITALQLDIKVKGLKLELLGEAMVAAQKARTHILSEMKAVIPDSRSEMSSYAPRVYSVQINPEFIREIIGKGGETIQGMQKDFNVDITVEDDGLVMVSAVDQAGADGALKKIKGIAYEPEVGAVFEDATVKSIMDFGAFVEFMPGKEALVHVSEISNERVENVSDVLKEGQKVKVKIVGIDKMGRTKLSMKDA
ncbi:MAG: polyribonucleotide nucleotidyltransferase [Candidatus Peregrinibacteria bacterium]|nr:polyribonucleotide nucleotidyltransferase [Candidatus Peregrinibacteria bacterium]